MQDLLIRCYYDGKTIEEAIEFIESSYGKKVNTRSINTVKKTIETQNGREWK